MREDVLTALSAVRDPELDEPITTLGFVASCTVSADGQARVRLRLPTYFCAPNFAFLMVADAYDAVSAVDGALYTASRMLFTQAREGNFPAQLARTNPRRKVPTAAIAITASCMFIGALLAYFFPASAYVFIASLATFGCGAPL